MKQLDYILFDKKKTPMLQQRDAEAKDMIHMGSDHRSVMATFVIEGLDKRRPWKTQTGDRKTKRQ